MPFRALWDGKVVAPANVPDQERVSCPVCGGSMHIRDGDERARHFVHDNTRAGKRCPSTSPGESATHARCVALAVDALQEEFGSQATRCGPEIEVDVSESASGCHTRRADALLEFDTENPYFGRGLIIEVQHKHHEKDLRMTTHDYLSAGYSVAWLSSAEFRGEKLDYSMVNEAFSFNDGDGYSVHDTSPLYFINCQSYLYTGDHAWGTVPSYVLTCEEDYEICTSAGCSLRRQYDEETGEYIYSPDVTTPDLPIRVLRNTIVGESIGGLEENLTQRYRNDVLEKALADRVEIGQCPGPKGFHEWGEPESLWGGYTRVELRPCQHCPVHYFRDERGYPDEWTHIFLSKKPDPEWNLLALKADPWQCENRTHEEDTWYEACPDCGVVNP